MEKKIIRYYQKEVYGRTYYYALDHTQEIHKLTGKKTLAVVSDGVLDTSILKPLEAMGFILKEVTREEADKILTSIK